jgi:uncharacterized protein DUF6599
MRTVPARRKKLPSKDQLFNPLARKVLRKQIRTREAVFGALFIALLAAAGLWIAAQKNRFDPKERDVSFQTLVDSSVKESLYEAPLQRWHEPGAEPAAGQAPAADLGIFPSEIFDGGWRLDGRVETYDPDHLYEKIDGGAEQYLHFGFQRLHYASLAHGSDLLSLELYDQGSFQNALGIYSDQKEPDQKVERRGALERYTTPAGCIGRYDRYYFKIAGNSGSPDVLAKAVQVADALARLPTGAAAEPARPSAEPGESSAAAEPGESSTDAEPGEPSAADEAAGPQSLPEAASGAAAPTQANPQSPGNASEPLPMRVLTRGLGLTSDALEYTPTDAFQYDFASDFWFGRLPDADKTRYFLHEAGSPEEARTLVARLVDEQKNEYLVVEQSEKGAFLQHQFLKTWFAVRVRGAVVYGIDGAAGRDVAEAALGRLDEGLSRETKASSAP